MSELRIGGIYFDREGRYSGCNATYYLIMSADFEKKYGDKYLFRCATIVPYGKGKVLGMPIKYFAEDELLTMEFVRMIALEKDNRTTKSWKTELLWVLAYLVGFLIAVLVLVKGCK